MKFKEISISDFKSKSNSEDLYIIDVREEYEFEEFNIGGINIPMSEVLSRLSELESESEIYVCCASGKRSSTVAYHLAEQLPNTTIYSLCGGVKAYLEI